MATLALAREFLSGYSKIDHVIQKRVHDLAEKCRLMSLDELNRSGGLHLETYTGVQKDPRARTIRLGDNHRGIVLVPEGTDQIILVDVLPHKEADRWMANSEFKVNAATGALEVVNAGAIAEQTEALTASASEPLEAEKPLLFSHRNDKDFVQLGIDDALLPVLRLLQTDAQLESLLLALPVSQAETLIQLTGDDTVEKIYVDIAGNINPESIDPTDLVAAITAPASQAHFHVVTDQDDLADVLARPLAQWRTYLHHSQREIAYRDTYNGPVRVTGGAGTGKTVVAMHRAKALAESLPTRAGSPILFTTFSRNLAQSIERDLHLLGGSDLLDVVDVINVDRLASQIVKEHDGRFPKVVEGELLRDLWESKVLELGFDFSPTFAIQEWEQVVLAQGLDSREQYFRASRAGRGVRLDRRQRADVWKVIEAATQEMESRGLRTHVWIAARAAGYLQQERVKPYRHVIVDEAQDLHEAQWRLLRAAVEEGPNDLFIVGDAHQRIYGRRSSLSRVGINIRGRSRRLRINYRTTRQILRWSLAVLGEADYDDLDEGTERQDIAGYHSFLDGAEPTTVGFTTKGDMIEGLVEQITRWIDDGVDERDIAVVARTKGTFQAIETALKNAGVMAAQLGPDLVEVDGVALGSMHRMKGLEYRCVAIIDASAIELPNEHFLTARADDPVQRDADILGERSLLYVAATRAREDLWVAWSGKPSQFLSKVLAATT